MSYREYANERWTGHFREHRLEQMAVDIARQDIDRRLTEMNNLREQINDERGRYPSRAEHEQLVGRITAMETQIAGFVGRMSMVAGLAGLLVSITTTIILKALNI